MATRNTLQNRITILMVIFSVFFIVAFTAIQLKNKMDSISVFNVFRARLGAFVSRNVLVSSMQTFQGKTDSEVKKIITDALDPFVISEILDNPVLISEHWDISDDDKAKLKEAKSGKKDQWLFYFVNQKERRIDMLIAFMPDNSMLLKMSYSLGNMYEAFKQVYTPIAMTVVIIIGANIIFAMILSRIIVTPVLTLNRFTKVVSGGDLDSRVNISTDDELQELGDAFNQMAVELKKMKEKAENANPLTKLPGNIVIMEEVEKRIKKNEKFIVLYSDLNNFKAFNDKYGIHKGDEAIKMTAEIMKQSVSSHGNPHDLVGHEGGDDFVIVTTPERGEDVAKEILRVFDSRVKGLYDQKDLDQGFFMSKDRNGVVQKFPIMGIALAGATNIYRRIESYSEVTNICAEVKKKAKSFPHSAYWIDERKDDARETH